MDWLDLLAVQGTLKSLLQHQLFSPGDKWGGGGAAEDGNRGTSVMRPGHKPKLGRDPGKESQPGGYPP